MNLLCAADGCGNPVRGCIRPFDMPGLGRNEYVKLRLAHWRAAAPMNQIPLLYRYEAKP